MKSFGTGLIVIDSIDHILYANMANKSKKTNSIKLINRRIEATHYSLMTYDVVDIKGRTEPFRCNSDSCPSEI